MTSDSVLAYDTDVAFEGRIPAALRKESVVGKSTLWDSARWRWVALIVILLVLLILAACAGTTHQVTSTEPAPEATSAGTVAPNKSCTGVRVKPGDNLVALTSSRPSKTTFCVHDGKYEVSKPIQTKNGNVYKGLYSDESRPQIKATNNAVHVFDATGSDAVSIESLAISNAGYLPASSSECHELHPCGGSGVHGGKNLTLYNDRMYNNADNGVGGVGTGLVINHSIIDHNGSAPFVRKGVWVDSAGVKSVNSYIVRHSIIHHNYWDGLWCDIECNALTVHGNKIFRNGNSGVHYEISTGPADISGNIIRDNGRAGIFIQSSKNADVHGNTFSGNSIAIGIGQDSRMGLGNVRVYDNTLNGDALSGCARSGVSCKSNR